MREIWKNRTIRIFLIAEAILLLLLLPGLFGKQDSFWVDKESLQGKITEETVIRLPKLKAGIYEIAVTYEAAEGSCTDMFAGNENDIYKGMYSDEISLYGGQKERVMTIWLTHSSEDVYLTFQPEENAALTVEGVQVTKTNAQAAVAVICFLILCLLVNSCLWCKYLLQGQKEAKEKRMLLWGLFGVVMVAALPLFTDYCLYGTELSFHLMRIEGLKDGLLSGSLPVRIQPGWLKGQGYAVSVFEGDLFLLVPAVLRMAGFPVQTAYRIYLLLINIATVAIAYGCFRGMLKDRLTGFTGSMLYAWMPYRLDVMYEKADLGEATALCFLPIVFYGFFRILMNDREEKTYKHVWVLPTVGLCCMFQSHVTSFLLAAGMMFLICLLFWKRTLQKKTLWVIAKTGLAVVILCAWMLVPILDCLFNGNLLIKYRGALPVQSKGGSLLHYLWTFFRAGNDRDFSDSLMVNTAPLGIGFAVSGLFFLLVWILFTGRYRQQRKEQTIWKMAMSVAITGCLLLFMSTEVFPWNTLRSHSRVIQLLTAGLNSPMELVPMVAVCLIFAGCVTIRQIRQQEASWMGTWLFGAVVATALVTTQFLTGDIVSTREPVRIYDGAALSTTQILDGAYLPMGADEQTGYFVENEIGGRDALRELLENDLQPAWYWRMSEWISLGGLLGLCCYRIVTSKKDSRNEDKYVEKI